MNVVRHDDKGIQFNAPVMSRQFVPDGLHYHAGISDAHDAIYDVAEDALAIMRNDGNKVRSSLAVVVALEPNGTAMEIVVIVGHARMLSEVA